MNASAFAFVPGTTNRAAFAVFGSPVISINAPCSGSQAYSCVVPFTTASKYAISRSRRARSRSTVEHLQSVRSGARGAHRLEDLPSSAQLAQVLGRSTAVHRDPFGDRHPVEVAEERGRSGHHRAGRARVEARPPRGDRGGIGAADDARPFGMFREQPCRIALSGQPFQQCETGRVGEGGHGLRPLGAAPGRQRYPGDVRYRAEGGGAASAGVVVRLVETAASRARALAHSSRRRSFSAAPGPSRPPSQRSVGGPPPVARRATCDGVRGRRSRPRTVPARGMRR